MARVLLVDVCVCAVEARGDDAVGGQRLARHVARAECVGRGGRADAHAYLVEHAHEVCVALLPHHLVKDAARHAAACPRRARKSEAGVL
eukprot:4676489-Pleurochrysis_carterae.AAC.3